MGPAHADGTSSRTPTGSSRHVMVRLGDRAVGIPVDVVAEMVQLGKLTALPDAPAHVRGVMLVRGESIAVHDLRGLLGMAPRSEEVEQLLTMFDAREQDHRRWLEELERSVREARPFTLAKDPHQCAFGKWYDRYKTTNILLESHLRRFDAPHRRIHALAAEVDGLVRAGDTPAAMRRIDETRGRELSEMMQLFAHLRDLVRSTSNEVAIVLRRRGLGPRHAYTVDLVEAVQDIAPVDAPREPPGEARRDAPGAFCGLYGPAREIALLLTAEELDDPRLLRAA